MTRPAPPDALGRALAQAPARQSETVAKQEVVRRVGRPGTLVPARRVMSAAVAEESRAPRLVEGDPVRDHVAQLARAATQ